MVDPAPSERKPRRGVPILPDAKIRERLRENIKGCRHLSWTGNGLSHFVGGCG
jgi:hypothetical protein